MTTGRDTAAHYRRAGLLERPNAALLEGGVDLAHPQPETLAPYDQFHGCGLEATQEIAAMLTVAPAHRLLDIGSGIGGPGRSIARRFGWRVTGFDLTAEFCAVARHLTRLTGLDSKIQFELGDAILDAVRRRQLRRCVLDERIDEYRRQGCALHRYPACAEDRWLAGAFGSRPGAGPAAGLPDAVGRQRAEYRSVPLEIFCRKRLA